MWSQCVQPHTHWVLWEFMVKINYIEDILRLHWKKLPGDIVITLLGQFLKELSMSGSGTWWTHCEEHCERNHYISHWGHCDHIDGHIVKELNICPLSTLWSHHWAHCDPITGYIVNVITMSPLGTLWPSWWEHCKCDHHVSTGHIGVTWLGTF